jgi:hypothetical protein
LYRSFSIQEIICLCATELHCRVPLESAIFSGANVLEMFKSLSYAHLQLHNMNYTRTYFRLLFQFHYLRLLQQLIFYPLFSSLR